MFVKGINKCINKCRLLVASPWMLPTSFFVSCPQCSHYLTIYNLSSITLKGVSLEMNLEFPPLLWRFLYAESSNINLQFAMQNLFWKIYLLLNFSPRSTFSLKWALNNNPNAHGTPTIKLMWMVITIITTLKVSDWSQEMAKKIAMHLKFYIFLKKKNYYQWQRTIRPLKLPIMHLIKADSVAAIYNM